MSDYTREQLEAAAENPTTVSIDDTGFAAAVFEHMVRTGRVTGCRAEKFLSPQIWMAARQLEHDRQSPIDVTPSCILATGHVGAHAAPIHEIRPDRNMWLEWDTDWRLFVAGDCPALSPNGDGCNFWNGHPDPHSHTPAETPAQEPA